MKLLKPSLIPFAMALVVLLISGCNTDTSQSVNAVEETDRITVQVNGEEFTSYLFSQEHKYPFFYPVVGPESGRTVTTWDQEPYPHHSSIYVSLDWVVSEDVERGNYWQPRDELETGQVFSRNPRILENDGEKVVIQDDTEWIVPATGTQHFSETRTATIWAPSPTVRIMDFELDFNVLEDLMIRPTGHSFFSVRMRPELSVGCMDHGPEFAHLGTGTIVDSQGNIDEEETRETTSEWAAYYGDNDGVTEGIAIIQHPDNPYYPAQWVTRDYGFISPSPFTFNDDPVEMEAGQNMFFKYRVVVFSGDHEEADIDGWYQDYVAN